MYSLVLNPSNETVQNTVQNYENIYNLGIKLGLNMVVIFVIIGLIFYPRYRDRDYAFTNISLNISIFLMTYLLSGLQLKLGFAFGLFAVFSILRYRTEQIPIRHMTYLFISIIIAVFNSLSKGGLGYIEIFIANGVIIFVIYIMELNFLHKNYNVKLIKYEKIDLIKPNNYQELIEDLSMRTGYSIKKVDIQSLNFLNDTAEIKIYYNGDQFYQLPEEK